jgi:hypothetical protein
MASAPESVNFEPLVSRNLIREKIRNALRLFAGRGRRFSVVDLGNGAGVLPSNIEKAMQSVHSPDYRPLKLEELISLAKFLGAPFASIYLELAGLGAFELMDGQQPLPRVLDACASPSDETTTEKRKRLLRELTALEEE